MEDDNEDDEKRLFKQKRVIETIKHLGEGATETSQAVETLEISSVPNENFQPRSDEWFKTNRTLCPPLVHS